MFGREPMSMTVEINSMRLAASDLAGVSHAVPAHLSVNPVGGAEWDQTISSFGGVVQEQLFAFARRRWPDVLLEPVLFSDGKAVVGGALIMLQALPLGIGSIAISKWGPIQCDPARADHASVYAGMVEALRVEYAEKRGMMLSILPRASLTRTNAEYEHLLSRGFRPGAELAFPNRYIVNLRLSDAEQRKSLHQKWRYHLNKSEKAGLTFEHAPRDRFEDFQVLYHSMTDRKQFADYSAYDTLTDLMNIEVEALRPQMFFVRHEGELVAGAVIFTAGDTAVYLYGATNDKALPLRAGYFMQSRVISWLRDNTSASWYDLGGTDGFQGLHQFKKGLVGDAGVITPIPRVANYAARPMQLMIGQGAFFAREAYHRARNKVIGIIKPSTRPSQTEADTQYLGD
jgi:Acetyltransferase (GNAT) domain